MHELALNRDTVAFLIEKAHEFHVKESVTFPEEQPLSPSDDWAQQILADHEGDPTLEEFRTTLDDLDREQQFTLVALMWLGRGDYGLDEWEDALATAQENWTPRTADYLIGTPMLADYLSEGLAQFDDEEDEDEDDDWENDEEE